MLPGLFGNKPPTPVLGLDISSAAVKLLELSRRDGRCRVESYAVCPLSGSHAGAAAPVEAIRRALRESGARLRTAAAAVADSAAITRRIELPAGLGEEDLEIQVTLEAEQHIPYPLEEVAIDFEPQGPGAAGQVEVLLAACRRETMDARTGAMEGAGLRPEIIDLEAHAMERACGLLWPSVGDSVGDNAENNVANNVAKNVAKNAANTAEINTQTNTETNAETNAGGALAAVDIGATTTTLSVFSGGRVIYTREQPFGGGQLGEEIRRRYGLSAEEASLARQQGGLPDDYESEVLEPFLDSAVRQVARSLQFFFSAGEYNHVDAVVLAGGVASMPGLEERVRGELGLPVTVANPFVDMAIAPRVDASALRDDAPALMIACGLALRSFD